MRQIAEMLYGDPIDFKKMASDLNLPYSLVVELIGRYAEKNKLLYSVEPAKEEGNGKILEFTAKKNR